MSASIKIMMMAVMLLVLSVSAIAAPMTKTAGVRVVHASPDAPAVDIWVNGGKAFTNLAFNEYTETAELPEGKYNVKVVPAGATEPVVIDADLNLRKNRDYTVIAVGKLSEISPLVITDPAKRVIPMFRSAVRFVHASPDAPAVDIAVKNGPVLFRGTEFKEVENYRLVMPGTYDLEVRLAGTSTVVLEVSGVMLQGGKAYTAIATGEATQGTLGALLLEDK